jgi:exopolyphosphatase/guanosine-5'-triphosphate,3'-diphosphate pyrophosphatase
VDREGRLADDAMERVYTTLDQYRQDIDRHRADRAVAVLTSAVRDAANGQTFAQTVGHRYRLEPHVLKGDDEARLTFRGATSDRDPKDLTPTLVIDVGGGSTELVIGAGTEMSFHVSTQAGVVRQTERHVHHDPPTAEEQKELAHDVRGILADAVPRNRRRVPEHAIAVAGTPTSLAAIAQELDPYDPRKVHGYLISATDCRQILERLAAMDLEQRRMVTGLDPGRAPTIVAGIIILLEVVALFGVNVIEVSENDILRGAALAYA